MQIYSTSIFIQTLSPIAPTVGTSTYRGQPCASLPTGGGQGALVGTEASCLALNKNRRTLISAFSSTTDIK